MDRDEFIITVYWGVIPSAGIVSQTVICFDGGHALKYR
jgi:hypothetical protein